MKTTVVVGLVVLGMFSAVAQTLAPGGPGGSNTTTQAPAQPSGPLSPAAGGPGAGENGTNSAPAGALPAATTNSAAQVGGGAFGFAPVIMVPANPAEPMRDQALNPTDAGLIQQMRQSVFPPGQQGAESVHFVLRNGAVRVTGNVPTPAEQKRIENAVSRIPGVTKVYDALTVAGAVTAQNPTPSLSTDPRVASPAGTSNVSPALPPTGRPNGTGKTNAAGQVP
jgi:hypothetical protein